VLQSSAKLQQWTDAKTLPSSTDQYPARRENSTKNTDIIARENSNTAGKARTVGNSTSIFHASSASVVHPTDSLHTNSGSVGFSASNRLIESTSKADSCVNMSIDEQRCLASATDESSGADNKITVAESANCLESCLANGTKQASTDELMEGSFRDGSRNHHDDIVAMVTKPLGASVPDIGVTVDSQKSIGRTDARSTLSFRDVAKVAIASSERRQSTSQVNDSLAYRDQSVVVLSSDEDDDDNQDDDKVGRHRFPESKQKPTAHCNASDISSKTLPDSKPQPASCEVSSSAACRPSTVVTIRPPPDSSVQSVGSSSSSVDMEKALMKRDNLSKLLTQKKVFMKSLFI